MRFDARSAKLLKPGEHLTVEGCPGLRIEATQTRRTWTYRYKSPLDGRMRQVKLGGWPEMSAAAAAAAWEQLRAERDAGTDPAAQKRAARVAAAQPAPEKAAPYTVERLLRDYVEGHVERARKPKGAEEVRRLLTGYTGPIQQLLPHQVTRSVAFSFLEGLLGTPVLAKQIRGELGAAWDYALDAGRISDEVPNWWRQIMRGKISSKGKKIAGEPIGPVKRVLSEQEVGQLLRWLPNFSRVVCDVLTLYLWTGARGSEIVSMASGEIGEEPDGLWWTLPRAKTKNAKREQATDLRVPLVGRAEDVVRRRLALLEDGRGYLFPSPGRALHVQQKAVQTAVHYHQPYSKTRLEDKRPRLPVTHWAPHDLRRTVRTMLASLDCPGEVAEAILGHMQPGVVGVYNRHGYDRQRREWLTRLHSHLEMLANSRAIPANSP